MKTILVTGDDGYKALGIKLIAHMLKDEYKVTIVSTKVQKSGAGGSPAHFNRKEWGYEEINEVDSYWVDGNPADAMEFAQGKFPDGFDYLLSGINWGENLGYGTLTSSGTGGAAIRGLGLGISERVIIMSWMQELNDGSWEEDSSELEITRYIENPGEPAKFIFEEIIRNDFWGKKLINVNLPFSATKEYKITKLLDKVTKYYKYPVIINENTYEYEKQVVDYYDETKNDISYDAGAILNGYISVTPFDIG